MSDREAPFLERWRREETIYSAWGRLVGQTVSDAVADLISPTELHMFLRMPVMARTKADKSLVEKAFYRAKPYEDPYEEIEDKVGLRFVVLLSEDTRIIEAAITATGRPWTANKARDFASERDEKPYEFDYQSLHYVVRAHSGLRFEGVDISESIPCEIQVRTLLQHAYSELTHDTIYKPSIKATPAMKRAAAKSMALIEATDDYFTQVSGLIKKMTAESDQINAFFSDQYKSKVLPDFENGALNSLIIDHYQAFLDDGFEQAVADWLLQKAFVPDVVRGHASASAAFRAPGILLAYYSVSKQPRLAKENSPLSDNELSIIYSDLGLSLG